MKTLKGLVLRERALGDNDKFLDILTDTDGLVEVLAKGVKKPNSKNSASAHALSYAKFCLNDSGGRFILNSSEPIRNFFDLSSDIEKYALASYFSEVLLYVATQEKPNNEVLRLILNSMHFLCLGNRDNLFLKAVFEMRLMSEIGLVPGLIGCCECFKYSAPVMQFDLRGGRLYCEECMGNRSLEDFYALDPSLLHYIRFIALTDMERIFNLNVPKDYRRILTEITERYCEIQLGRHFQTLDFYKTFLR